MAALVAMGQQQLAASYGDTVPPDPAGVEAVLTTLVTGAASVVFVAEQADGVVGMIGLVRYPHPMSGVGHGGRGDVVGRPGRARDRARALAAR